MFEVSIRSFSTSLAMGLALLVALACTRSSMVPTKDSLVPMPKGEIPREQRPLDSDRQDVPAPAEPSETKAEISEENLLNQLFRPDNDENGEKVSSAASPETEEEPMVALEIDQEKPKPSGFWENRAREGEKWTAFAMQALEAHGQDLLKTSPTDAITYCPAFASLSMDGRRHFWVKFLSAMAAAESSFDPTLQYREKMRTSSGDPVISRGLLQISFESAADYACGFEKPEDLHRASPNLACGVRILSQWIPRDGVISGQSPEGEWRGGARYWSTLRESNPRSALIRKLLLQTPLCQLPAK